MYVRKSVYKNHSVLDDDRLNLQLVETSVHRNISGDNGNITPLRSANRE